MNLKADVVILSVLGRGLYLANKVCEAGMKVAYVDLTPQLGCAGAWERLGPFGVLGFETWPVEQQSRLEVEAPLHAVPGGLQVWLADGPVEFKGPLTDHRLKALEVDSLALDFVRGIGKDPLPLRLSKQKLLGRQPFEKTWIEALSRDLASAVYNHPADRTPRDSHLNLFQTLSVRRASEVQTPKILSQLRDRGVEVFASANLVDVSLGGAGLDGVEIRSDRSGMVLGQQFVWAMTPEETKRLPPHIGSKIFQGESATLDWYWSSFELRLNNESVLASLPEYFLTIDDLLLPWTHENFVVFQKSGPKEFRTWLRLPMNQRFQRGYMEVRAGTLVGALGKRLKGAGVEIASMPAEYHLNFDELGPAVWPIRRAGENPVRSRLKNVILDGPDWWPRLDLGAQFEAQSKIFDQLSSWWKKLTEKKGELRDSAVHPS